MKFRLISVILDEIYTLSTRLLSVSPQLEGVVLLPGLVLAGLGVVVQVTSVDTSRLLAGSGKTSGFSSLVDSVDDPVDLGVSSDGLVRRVDEDDFEVLVGRVLVNPVRVQDSQVGASSANSFFGSRTERSLVLQVVDTLVGGLTVSSTLGDRSLSATSSDSDSVDDETLLGLVTESSSLVGSRRSRGTVDDVLLSVFPASDSVQESHDIGLLLSSQFGNVLVGPHGVCTFGKVHGLEKIFQLRLPPGRAMARWETLIHVTIT